MGETIAATPNLAVLQDLGSRLELVTFAGGKEIARVTLTPKAALSLGLSLVDAAALRLFRENS